MTTTGKLFFGSLTLLIIGGGLYYYNIYAKSPELVVRESFTINGEPITLTNGKFEKESEPGSQLKTVVTYFGNEVKADFNNDGVEDKAFLVTETTGGSGSFYYLATSLGGEAVFIGDRIAPQTTEYKDLPAQAGGEIVVNYADRNPGEPMTTAPSLAVSRYFKFEGGKLVEIKKIEPQAETGTSTIDLEGPSAD